MPETHAENQTENSTPEQKVQKILQEDREKLKKLGEEVEKQNEGLETKLSQLPALIEAANKLKERINDKTFTPEEQKLALNILLALLKGDIQSIKDNQQKILEKTNEIIKVLERIGTFLQEQVNASDEKEEMNDEEKKRVLKKILASAIVTQLISKENPTPAEQGAFLIITETLYP